MVSIIIPCFNAEKYISEAIQSALDQSYDNCEIIVLDDGSTDGSLNVIRQFSKRIRWESGPNQGGCITRNRGIDLAAGEFIKFLDADDVLTPWDVEVQINAARQLDDSSVVIGKPSHGEDYLSMQELLSKVSPEPPGLPIFHPPQHWLRNSFLISPPLHRKAILQQLGGFDSRCLRGQEHDLHTRMILHGISFYQLNSVSFVYRAHDSISRITNNRLRPEILANVHATMSRHIEMCDDPDLKIILAQNLWFYGRSLLPHGQTEWAMKAFQLSRATAGISGIGGGWHYRAVMRLFGPVRAERYTLAFRNLCKQFHRPAAPPRLTLHRPTKEADSNSD